MVKETQLRITLQEEAVADILVVKSAQSLKIKQDDITGIKVLRKSIDARKALIILNYKVAVLNIKKAFLCACGGRPFIKFNYLL